MEKWWYPKHHGIQNTLGIQNCEPNGTVIQFFWTIKIVSKFWCVITQLVFWIGHMTILIAWKKKMENSKNMKNDLGKTIYFSYFGLADSHATYQITIFKTSILMFIGLHMNREVQNCSFNAIITPSKLWLLNFVF